MAKKEFTFYGKPEAELKKMSIKEFALILPSKQRRSLARGLSHTQQQLLKKIGKDHKNIKTHSREMIIVPQMIGKVIKIYSGKEFVALQITREMLGHRLGEFAVTRKSVAHSAPGIGATRSSSSLSVK